MSAWQVGWRLVAGVLLIASNAFFVAIEFALTRLRQFDEEEIADDPGLKRAWEMTEKLEIYLTGCQLGISITSIVLGVVAEPAMTHLLSPIFEWLGITGGSASFISVVVSVIIINLTHKIWGEQTPTYLGVERPLQVSRMLAPALYWWSKVMYPVIYAGDGLAKWTLRLGGIELTRSWTEAEAEGDSEAPERPRDIRASMLEVLSRSEVGPERREEVMNAFDIGDTPVREIMVERDDIIAMSVGSTPDDNFRLVSENQYNRFPLIGEDLEEFLGIIYVPILFDAKEAILNGDLGIEDVATEPMTVPADCPVDRVIDRMQSENQELALVTRDERVVGLVTATDAFEAIIGDLEDPMDVDAA